MKKKKPAGIAGFVEKVEANIAESGLSIIVTATETAAGMVPMAYTVGLSDKDLPEVIVFGLPAEVSQSFLNRAHSLLKAGVLGLDEPSHEFGNLPVVFKNVMPGKSKGYLNVACSRAGKPVAALQLVWSDPQSLFPWQTGFDAAMLPMQLALYETLH